jgi:hypothetical protein
MNISILLRGSVPPAIDGTDDDGAADGGGGDEGGGDAGGVPRQSARRRKANLAGCCLLAYLLVTVPTIRSEPDANSN